MFKKRSLLYVAFVAIMIISTVASCAPRTVEVEKLVTQVVKEQVTVMVEGTGVVKEVEKIVEVTPVPTGPVEVVYTFRANNLQPDKAMIEDAINEIMIPKINVKLVLDPVEAAIYNERMQLRMAANETCDIVFTAPWTNNYYNNVINGSLYPLDDLLPEYAPGLWASMPPSTWEAARFMGHIYGVINQQIFPKVWGVHVIKEYADKYNLDLATIRVFEDMEPFAEAVLKGEGGNVTPYCKRSIPFYMQYYGMAELGPGISTRIDDATVLNIAETQEWIDLARTNRRWFEAGYVFQDEIPGDVLQEIIKGNGCAFDSHVEKPTQGVELKARYGQDWIFKNLSDPITLDTGGASATMNAICATSKHPVEAMKVLEMLNTNKEIYRLLSHGIEDKHWVWVDKDLDVISLPEGKTDSDVGWSPGTDWMFGNQFNAAYKDVEVARLNAWEQTRRINASATPHILLGFTFDRKPVETEIAQYTAIEAEYCAPVLNGWIPFEGNYETCLQMLEQAGIQVIVDEAQKQIDLWMETK
jgi:putative aldouronate transport system substrate-binding protein